MERSSSLSVQSYFSSLSKDEAEVKAVLSISNDGIVGTSRMKARMAQVSSDKLHRDALLIQIRSSCSSEQILKFKFSKVEQSDASIGSRC